MTVLVTWLVVGAAAVALVVVFALRSRSHDDEHSVIDYHRQLHTLEELGTHPAGEGGVAEGPGEGVAGERGIYPDPAFRVTSRSTTVRLTEEPGQPVVPPVPPPAVPDPSKPVTFDDAGPVNSTPAAGHGTPWLQDRAMHGINHRPRRLMAPALAVVAVSAVIVVLLVTGSHSPPPHRNASSSHTHHKATTTTVGHRVTTRGRTTTGHPTSRKHHGATTTTTTVPVVSLPHSGSAHSAVYAVQPSTYTLAMSATTAQCWVDATEAGSGTVLFTGVLSPGQTQTVRATGGVSLVVGAPNSFAANINGTSVSFPFGFQAPFTMQFLQATN